MTVSGLLQSNFGKVEITKITTETDGGIKLCGNLYKPDTATEETPAPAVVVVHGWWKTKESQSSVSMELARRGFVVFNIDMYGHGGSETLRANFTDSWDALQLLYDLPYVDNTRLGMTGHSMGGKCCSYCIDQYKKEGGPNLKSIVVAGTDLYNEDENGEFYNFYEDRDVCLIAARYDDFEYHGSTIHGIWYNAPRDFWTTDRAKAFVNFGEKPENWTEEVVVDKMYTKDFDGVTAHRMLNTPTQIHSWHVLSPTSTGYIVSFLQDTLDAPNKLPASNQTAFLCELFKTLGLASMFVFIVYFVIVLVEDKNSTFACLAAETEVKPLEKPKGAGMAWFWAGIIIVGIVSYFTLFPLAVYCNSNASKFLPIVQARALGYWGMISGALTLLLCFLNYKFYGKKNGFDLKERGVILEKSKIGKTILLSLAAVAAGYVWVYIADYFFHSDFRFWTLAARAFESDKALYTLRFIPLFLLYYIPNSIATNCFRYNKLGGKDWVNTLIVSVTNALGILAVLFMQYSTFVITGYSKWHDNGSIKSAIGWSYAVVAVLIITPIIGRKIYKKTNNPYLAGIINGILVAILSCTSTTTLL